MFTKAVVDGRILKFAFAPPQTELDLRTGKNDERKEQPGLPKAPRHNTPPLYRSIYYYWWEFLRLNKDYIACCERGGQGQFAVLYGDFGDVREGVRPTIDNDGDHFKAWWIERGAYLFAEPVDPEQPKIITDLAAAKQDGKHVVLWVPFSPNLNDTIEDIRALLTPHFNQYHEDVGHFSQALYRPKKSHPLSSLNFSLRAKKAWLEYSDVVGRNPTLAQTYVMARTDGEIDYQNLGSPDDTDAAMRNAATAALKRADLWIKNVVYGNFPDDYADDPSTNNDSGMPTAERRKLHRKHIQYIKSGVGLPYKK